MAVLIRCLLRCLIALPLIWGAVGAHAQEAMTLQESKVRAGLIYNFLKYTQWPQLAEANAHQNMNVCLMGGDAFEGNLYPLEGRTAQQFVIRIISISQLSQTQNCHMVYLHPNQAGNLQELLPALKERSILTVSHISGFARAGGMVELTTQEDRRIHIYISRSALADSNLKLGDRLAKLAEFVP